MKIELTILGLFSVAVNSIDPPTSLTTQSVGSAQRIANLSADPCLQLGRTLFDPSLDSPIKWPPPGMNRIKINVFLQSFIGVDTLQQTVRSSILMRLTWQDARFGDPLRDSGCKRLPVPLQYASTLWYPKFSIVNSIESVSPGDLDATPILLMTNGKLVYSFEMKTDLVCEMNLRNFPFDKHVCNFHVVPTRDYLQDLIPGMERQLAIIDSSSAIVKASKEAASNPLFKMGRSCTLIGSEETYMFSHAYLLFEIERNPEYYYSVVFVPTAIVSILMGCVFIQKADDDEKIGVALTVLLSYFVVSYSLSVQLPVSSINSPLIYWFYAYQMLLSAVATIVAILVRNRHKYEADHYWEFYEADNDDDHEQVSVESAKKRSCKGCNQKLANTLNIISLVAYIILCLCGYFFYFATVMSAEGFSNEGSVAGENRTCTMAEMMTSKQYVAMTRLENFN